MTGLLDGTSSWERILLVDSKISLNFFTHEKVSGNYHLETHILS